MRGGASGGLHQVPDSLTPGLWPKYYWSVRTLPAPGADAGADGAKPDDAKKGGDDDNSRHAGLDVATAITANAPPGANPSTYTLTLVYRNFDIKKTGEGDTEVGLGHEPNVSVQISPDPNSPAVYQAAISLVNVHVKRHWGLLKPDVEFSLGGTGRRRSRRRRQRRSTGAGGTSRDHEDLAGGF